MLFEIGEIVELRLDPTITSEEDMKYNGEDVEVIGGLNTYVDEHDKFFYGYAVLILKDDEHFLAKPHELKRKNEPPSVFRRYLNILASQTKDLFAPAPSPAFG